MITPEERIRERERIAIAATAARLPIEEVSWSGIWAGFMTAMAVAVVLTALGIAVGISVLDVNPAGAHDARSWTIGAGLWTFFTYIIALFGGGAVATRTGGYTVRPSGTVVGTAVWVLSLAAVLLFGVIRLALIATPLLRAPLGPADGMPPAIAPRPIPIWRRPSPTATSIGQPDGSPIRTSLHAPRATRALRPASRSRRPPSLRRRSSAG